MSIYFSNYAQQFGSLLIVLLGAVFFRRKALSVQLIFYFGLASFSFQMMSNVFLFANRNQYQNLTFNIYVLLETLILLAFFYTLFTFRAARNAIIIITVSYFASYFSLMTGHWSEFISSTRTMRDLILVICSLSFFYFLLKETPAVEITKYPMFWIATAMLFYFAGTFVLSLSLDYLVKVLRNDLALIWTIRNCFRFLFCLVVCYGLWLDLKQVKAKFAVAK